MVLTLDRLQPGQTATVSEINGAPTDNQRLMHMGLVEGSEISVVRRAPSGDPIEISLMGYALSLRLSDAKRILVEDGH